MPRQRWKSGLDDLLEGRRSSVRDSVYLILGAAALFGAVVGSHGAAPLQVLYSALKLPLLLLVSSGLCLPCVLTVTFVLGHGEAGRELARHLLAAQAVVAVALASLAPLLALGYLSTTSYDLAKLASALCFALASGAGHVSLRRSTRSARRRLPTIRAAIRGWSFLYVLVGVQLAWLLRPFVGRPGMPTTFLREGAWGNAYVHLAETLARTLGIG